MFCGREEGLRPGADALFGRGGSEGGDDRGEGGAGSADPVIREGTAMSMTTTLTTPWGDMTKRTTPDAIRHIRVSYCTGASE